MKLSSIVGGSDGTPLEGAETDGREAEDLHDSIVAHDADEQAILDHYALGPYVRFTKARTPAQKAALERLHRRTPQARHLN